MRMTILEPTSGSTFAECDSVAACGSAAAHLTELRVLHHAKQHVGHRQHCTAEACCHGPHLAWLEAATAKAAATTRAMSCSGVSNAVPALRPQGSAAGASPSPVTKFVCAPGPRSSTTARSYARAASASAANKPRWWICAMTHP